MAEERKFHSKLREGLMFICKSLIFSYKNSISKQYQYFYFEMIQKLAYYVLDAVLDASIIPIFQQEVRDGPGRDEQ